MSYRYSGLRNISYSKEMRSHIEGTMQHAHLVDEVVDAASHAGLEASRAPTSPKGHHYAKVVSNTFVMGCIRDKSKHWNNAKHKKELGKLNEAVEPFTQDMFEACQVGTTSDKIFLVATVTENPLQQNLPYIAFIVPFSDLTNFHMRASLDEIRAACHSNTLSSDDSGATAFPEKASWRY
ncbi:MAG: hypothetical protein L3K52_02675 [Candidatus Thiothrix sulfatifontis]|nr:MAG: hypothetical protein L3K52_02675 [Candidatus Thiothrix sulfatifontis]